MRTGNEATKLVVNYYWLHTSNLVACVHWNLTKFPILLREAEALSCSNLSISSSLPHSSLSPPSVASVQLPVTLMSSQRSQTTSWGCMTSLTLANTSRASPTHTLSRESGWKTDSVSSALISFLVLTFVDIFLICFMLLLSMSTNVLFF